MRQLTTVALLLALLPALAEDLKPSLLRYASGGDAVRLDPADISDGESAKVTQQVFDTLVRFKSASFDLEPALAERWEQDGLVWTFHLRKGVRFHDGTALTASVAKASLERLKDPAKPYASSFAILKTLEAPDDLTLVLKLERPYAPLLRNLAMFCAGIVPPAASQDPAAFSRAPVGTGPFRFVSWTPNEKIVLKANHEHWDGRPAADTLIFLPVPDNAKRLKLLQTGGADLADGISLSDVASVEADKGLSLHAIRPGANLAYLAFHTGKKPFDNPKVRRALAMAVDRAGIVGHLFSGRAAAAESIIPQGFLGHENAPFVPFDPAAAKKLLAEAGFPDGFETELWAMPNPRPYLPEPRRVAQAIQANLAAIGVKARIISPEWAAYLEGVQTGQHPMCLMGWTTDNGDPDNFAYVLLDKDNAQPGAASNVSFYQDGEVHTLLTKAQETADETERGRLYREAMALVRRDCPVLPLATTDALAVTRAQVQGFELHPVGQPILRRARLVRP